MSELAEIWDDCDCLNPRQPCWTMPPREFAAAKPGIYRGFRAARESNLLTPYRTGGIYVAQNARYASVYHMNHFDVESEVWRVEVHAKRPFGTDDMVVNVSDRVIRKLPEGTDCLVLKSGDTRKADFGPVIVALDPSIVKVVGRTWPVDDVLTALKEKRDVPEDILWDYPEIQARIELLRERMGDRYDPMRI